MATGRIAKPSQHRKTKIECRREYPTAEELREVLHYNPCSGLFTWKKKPGNVGMDLRHNRHKAGKVAGHRKKSTGYVNIVICKQQYRAHRLAWIWWYGFDPLEPEIDHENRIRHDNRISNLRLVTPEQQNLNRAIPCNNTSGIRGVRYREKYHSWIAQIKRNGKQIHIGSYQTREEAHTAYLEAVEEHARDTVE